MGLDGTTYRVCVTRGWNSIDLRWWGSAPTQWESLAPLLQRIVDLAGPRAASVIVE